MNYASIRTCDIANGDGVRVSLFVSGCTHGCPGCFNREAQSFTYGKPFTRAVEDELIAALAPDYIAGLTLLGGEPMEPANQRALMPFLRRVRERFADEKTVWIYSGCTVEELMPGGAWGVSVIEGPALTLHPPAPPTRWVTEVTADLLALADVLVDGPFIESLKDISLKFRGSANQRILALQLPHPSAAGAGTR